jgi:hypothetical protein
MKQRLGFRWLLVAVIVGLLGSICMAAAQDGPALSPQARGLMGGAPTVVSYQGQVRVSGTPYTGTGYFKFAVVNLAGATTYWSNDGTSSGGGEPTNTVTLAVNNGLFNVLLGDTTLGNMTALPASAFSGTDRALRVWFSSDGSTFVLLIPDRRIAAAPYALQAVDADTLDGQHASGFVTAGSAWSLSGNAGTTPGTNYLGTSDGKALEIKVNGARALRLEPNANSPNLLGGYGGNWLASNVYGAVIGGGGLLNFENRVTDNLGTVGGGIANQAGDNAGTTSDRQFATVGGGYQNTASGDRATVGGGQTNTASGDRASVGGGYSNTAGGQYASVAGGRTNSAGAVYATVGGGYSNDASQSYATVAGGDDNTASGDRASVGGGQANTASGGYSAVPGGANNVAQGAYSFAAGRRAKANNQGCFVWADSTDADLPCSIDNQFAVRANGGVSFQTGSAAVQVNGNTVWHAGNDGAGSGLDADLLDGVEGSGYQVRVSGTCAVGSTIRAVNADGTVVCASGATSQRPVFSRTDVDSTGIVGYLTSITIGVDGQPVISYYDFTNGDLKVAHCGDAACTTSTTRAVDSTGNVGGYTSITIGADGLPVISYYDLTNLDLKVAHCGDAACTTSTTVAVDTAGTVGEETSITIGVDGLPVISYYDRTNGDLKVAHCGDAACTSSTTVAVDTGGDVGHYSSITIGVDGLPVISYHDGTNGDLKVAHCGDAACTSSTTWLVDAWEDVGHDTSITIGADGLPVISYGDNYHMNLKVAHCWDAACTDSTLRTVDWTDGVGAFTSITIGADGLPVISYWYYTNEDLKVAHCGDAACTTGNTLWAVDTGGEVGAFTSITIGVDGLPVVSYCDDANGDLKVLHCSNVFCVPFWRRR